MAETGRYISQAELENHKNPGDLWISTQGKIYDVTEWSHDHPGGALPLLNLAGQDATDAFVAYHPGLSISFYWVLSQRLLCVGVSLVFYAVTALGYISVLFQIEHHLFPRLPRCHHRKISLFVKELCKKHNLQYHSASFWKANAMTIGTLRSAALQARDLSNPVPKNLVWAAVYTHG
ncbi:hypothetical protein CRYUN_Cryun03dG0032100 [Craigia yunnanensis]